MEYVIENINEKCFTDSSDVVCKKFKYSTLLVWIQKFKEIYNHVTPLSK